ncbi:MAG: hypothetical protein R3B57_05370 [Phycisphaerales bacterium]
MGRSTIQIFTTSSQDGSTRVEVRRVGWLGRVAIALAALMLLVLAFFIAIPLLLVAIVVGAGILTYWRLRLILARRRELGTGRRNVRVVRRRDGV